MAEFAVVRGSYARLDFAVTGGDGLPFNLAGSTLSWSASNGTRSLAKASGSGITVANAALGLCYVEIQPADTASWDATEAPFFWSLVLTTPELLVITADTGSLAVAAPAPTSADNTYAVPDDILLDPQILAELSAEDGNVPAWLVVQRALIAASAIIDSHLGGRYSVPVTETVPRAILRPYCVALAKLTLLERRAAGRYDQGAEKAYDRAIEWLQGLADGSYTLSGAAPAPAPASPSCISYGGFEAVFSDGLGGL